MVATRPGQPSRVSLTQSDQGVIATAPTGVILSEAKNLSVTVLATARTFASEDCHNRVFQSALVGLGCGTTVVCAQPGVILSEAKNLSVTFIAIRKTTERFFASLRMTARAGGPGFGVR